MSGDLDSRHVVYSATQETLDSPELFSVPILGGSTTKLSGPRVTNGNIFQFFGARAFLISPDSTRVIYRAEQDTDETFELFSVPITGGDITKLSGPMVAEGDVHGTSIGFQVSPDSRWVVYLADQERNGVEEIFSVPIEGGPAVRLNGPMVQRGDALPYAIQISPDSSRVVYVADQMADGVDELFSVPIGGGPATKLNGPLVPFGRVSSTLQPRPFEISSDSSRVVYVASQEDDQSEELYSVPIAGGPVVKLNGPLPQYGDVLSFAIGSDSRRVVFSSHGPVFTQELYSVPIEGGSLTRLSVDAGRIPGFRIDPAARTVVYAIDSDGYHAELFGVPIGGGTSTRLKAPLIPPALSSSLDTFRISPDSSRVVYVSWRDTWSVNELYAVPIGGGESAKLNGPLVYGGEVAPYAGPEAYGLTPDGRGVVYLADQEQDEVIELFLSSFREPTGKSAEAPLR
jgi:Tol biopolymer transport system component